MSETDPRHLSDEEMAAYLDDALAPGARERAEEHLSDCRTCRAELVAVSTLLSAEQAVPVPPVGASRLGRRLRRGAALTGVAAAAVLASLLLVGPPDAGPEPGSPEASLRALGAAEGVRPLRALRPPAVVGPGTRTFRWEPLGKDVLYRFAIVAEDGAVVWSASTAEDTVVLPDGVTAELAPGQYYWRTDALLPDLTSATTGEQPFRVEP